MVTRRHRSGSRPAPREDTGYGDRMTDGMTTDRRFRRSVAVALALLVAVTTGACGGSAGSKDPGTTSQVATGLVGKRYCEVLLVRHDTGGFSADVYNSYPLNACPEARWNRLDATAIASRNGALFAELNGPRYWLMNSIHKIRTGGEVIKTFGGIAMIMEATVVIGPSIVAAQVPYTPHTVNRQAAFTFAGGRQVYELVDPSGTAWVMQTWSQAKDTTLAEGDLAGLAPRLTLPPGWTFRVRTLGAPLVIATASQAAQVLQDNFQNSYSRETAG